MQKQKLGIRLGHRKNLQSPSRYTGSSRKVNVNALHGIASLKLIADNRPTGISAKVVLESLNVPSVIRLKPPSVGRS